MPALEARERLNPKGSEARINLTPDGDSFYLPSVLAEAHGWTGPPPADTMAEVAQVCEGLWNPRERMGMSIFGKWNPLPRDKVFMGAYEAIDGCEGEAMVPIYRYSGNTGKRKSTTGRDAYIPVVHCWGGTIVEDIARHLSALTGFVYNQVVINHYRDGSDHISYHVDKRRDMAPGVPITTLSLCEEGGERPILLRRENPTRGDVVSQTLAMGDVYAIGYETNVTHKHCIPKRMGVRVARTSMTFRRIDTAQRVRVVVLASGMMSYERLTVLCPCEGYFSGSKVETKAKAKAKKKRRCLEEDSEDKELKRKRTKEEEEEGGA